MANYIDSRKINIHEVVKSGILSTGKILILKWPRSLFDSSKEVVLVRKVSNASFVELAYFTGISGQKVRIHYLVKMTGNKAHFGGFKRYFLCPIVKNGVLCSRKVSVLFKPESDTYFGCRHCHKIKYSTQVWNAKSSIYAQVKHKIYLDRYNKLLENNRTSKYRNRKTKRVLRIEKVEKLLGFYH